ncbi:hypothetical protein H8784_07855 [Parabacteroides acidifaciens]|uniref:LPP20 lipoprotein n=1 Tax=Parabacteroides acidifaciens TaxID=2290935 RepID=A0A3D8HF73_9BACT|nr:hypothetical protein [Parabacteroides acidifaciens]MBC8601637.1 hypothetical protein [Parabacteroides acidifaciens]RDU49625.1 hypothetical protein DWU89_08025 [Parabacteroides acidifaciens]
MKNLKGFIAIGIIASTVLCGCGGSKKATTQWSGPSKMKIELDECQELAQQKPEVRSWGEGINFRLSTASNYAEMQARGKFARAIAAKIKTAQEESGFTYGKYSSNMKEGAGVRDEGSNSNEMTLQVAEETIKNTVIIKTSQYLQADGSYQVFVCLEYKDGVSKLADDIVDNVKQRIPDEERIKMQYEFQKFRDRVEEELKKEMSDVSI